MTRSEVMRDFMKKTVVPVAVALLLFSIFSRIFVEKWIAGFFPDLACLRSAFWHWKDVHADSDWLWHFRDSRCCCTQPCPRRSNRRRNSDLEAGSCPLVSAPDHIQTYDLRKEEKT